MRVRGLSRWLVLALGLVACRGPEGSTGRPGPDGAPGPAGPLNRLVITSVIRDSLDVYATLPDDVGSDPNAPPALACYLGNGHLGRWYVVSDGASPTDPWCELSMSSGTHWVARMHHAPTVGYAFAFVVVY